VSLVKRLLLLLLVLLAGIALSALPACSEPPRGIVLWHPYRGAEQAALERVVQRFESERGERVTVLAIPYEAYLAKLEAAIPRGNGPDLFVGPHNRLGEYRLHRLVAPVGDAFPDADVDRYDAVSVTAVTEEGARYAVPLASKCVALYYDTRVFDRPPRTLEELAAKKGGLGSGAWPLAYEAQSVYYHAPLLHAFGGRLFDDAPPAGQSRFAMTGQPAERSLEKARELVASHVVPEEASGDLVKQLFESGRAAAVFSGPWLAADLGETRAYAVAPLPSIEGVGPMKPFLTVDGAFMTPEGAKSPPARALARFLGGAESAEVRAELGKQIVATRAYWEAASKRPARKEREILEAFRAASADAIPMPTSMSFNPVWDPAKEALRKVLRGDVSGKEALEEARSRYEDVMRPPPAAPSSTPLVLFMGLVSLAGAIAIVRRVRAPGFRREVRASRTAYRYVTHAAITVLVLVVFPLVAGAMMSFYSGTREDARFVGLANYVEILTARGKPLLSHGSFYLTLLVTVVWTVINVTFHVGIGLVLGIALANPLRKLRAVYRVLLIVPWAVPSYVTALAWKGMFHRQFGAVNALLGVLGVPPVSWFSKFSTAFAANIATNVWLGFPFMMVVVMGALTSISKDVLEAAEVDGATRWQTFRLVTLPLLKPTLLPAVVLGSVWTFNMFNVVYLVSGGEPDGTTDTLVSEAYRWAFARNAQLGYAAAYAVVIFGLLALMSRLVNRWTGASEAA
jgi:arabinogalactan oligomer/maltooligosaccharide transport system permease protein